MDGWMDDGWMMDGWVDGEVNNLIMVLIFSVPLQFCVAL